jgi:hypothetical protein
MRRPTSCCWLARCEGVGHLAPCADPRQRRCRHGRRAAPDGGMWRSPDVSVRRNRRGAAAQPRLPLQPSQRHRLPPAAAARQQRGGRTSRPASGLQATKNRPCGPVFLEHWWSQGGSNSRPRHCERRALPAELWPHRGAQYSGVVARCKAGACSDSARRRQRGGLVEGGVDGGQIEGGMRVGVFGAGGDESGARPDAEA